MQDTVTSLMGQTYYKKVKTQQAQITTCARKHNPLNYKSNIKLGYCGQEKDQQLFRPSIKVVGNFGYDMTNLASAGKSTRLANYFNTGSKNTEFYWRPDSMKNVEPKQVLR